MPEPAVCGRLIQWISKVAGLAFGAGIIWKVEEEEDQMSYRDQQTD